MKTQKQIQSEETPVPIIKKKKEIPHLQPMCPKCGGICKLLLPTQPQEEWEQREWGGWKIVSDMLDHPDENGIYNTSKCYKELYDFISNLISEIRKEERERIAGIINDRCLVAYCDKDVDAGSSEERKILDVTNRVLEEIANSVMEDLRFSRTN